METEVFGPSVSLCNLNSYEEKQQSEDAMNLQGSEAYLNVELGFRRVRLFFADGRGDFLEIAQKFIMNEFATSCSNYNDMLRGLRAFK